MLLYEEGAHFEKHRDTKKTRGMFGILVVALPSEHSGGQVETMFDDESRMLDTAEASEFDYTALTWYSDVEHTAKPITSGSRFVLTYNLIHTAFGAPPLAATIDDNSFKLNRILRNWGRQTRDAESEPEILVYILAHKYTDANLRLSHLKGRDWAKADQLDATCKDAGFALLLANLERERSDGCEDDPEDGWGGSWRHSCRDREARMDLSSHDDEEFASDEESDYGDCHPIIDVIDETLRLSTVVQNDGNPLAKNITLDEEDIIQSNPFKRAPDGEDFEGYTGNEGTSTTHYYHNSCLVILPKEDVVKFLINPSTTNTVNLQPALEGLINQVRRGTDDQGCKTELARACRYILEKRRTAKSDLSDANLRVLADAALALRQPLIFESAAGSTTEMLPVEVLRELGGMIVQEGFRTWQAAFVVRPRFICSANYSTGLTQLPMLPRRCTNA